MNIFKILANGDGSINEANVSAFLGYLLDPSADHAIGLEFLRRFLESIHDNDDNFEEVFYSADYQIFYEQAFKEENKSKQIVDLVIVCYSTNMGIGKESLLSNFIENTKEVHRLYLIENKIRKGALTKDQLVNQFQSTVSRIPKSLREKVTSIYLTPDGIKYKEEFRAAEESIPDAHHILWKDTDGDEALNILKMLYDLLLDETHGKIEPLNEYTLHTIRAFCQFIENDFLSARQITTARKKRKTGEFTKNHEKRNIELNVKHKLETLKDALKTRTPALEIEGPDLSNPSNPRLIIKINSIIISINAGFSSRDIVNVTYGIDKSDDQDSRIQLSRLASFLNLEIKKPKSKFDAYLRIDEDQKKFKIENIDLINREVNKAIKQIRDMDKKNTR